MLECAEQSRLVLDNVESVVRVCTAYPAFHCLDLVRSPKCHEVESVVQGRKCRSPDIRCISLSLMPFEIQKSNNRTLVLVIHCLELVRRPKCHEAVQSRAAQEGRPRRRDARLLVRGHETRTKRCPCANEGAALAVILTIWISAPCLSLILRLSI